MHVVAKRLGHKDPSVTLNFYADAHPRRRRPCRRNVHKSCMGRVASNVERMTDPGVSKSVASGPNGRPPGVWPRDHDLQTHERPRQDSNLPIDRFPAAL